MADLNETQAAQAVKIIGSSSSGIENTPVTASSNGELQVSDISNNGGTQGAITVGTSAIQAMVGVSPLANRKTLTVFNNSNNDIYFGYTNTVTAVSGTPIFKNQFAEFSVGPLTQVWLISGATGNNVRITENA
jgi:hypothetical protein